MYNCIRVVFRAAMIKSNIFIYSISSNQTKNEAVLGDHSNYIIIYNIVFHTCVFIHKELYCIRKNEMFCERENFFDHEMWQAH